MQFHFHANQSHFHKNGFALRPVLKQRHKGTRKWPISRAVLIFCLGSPVEFYCKTCFEVLRIASPGTKIKMFRENNAYFDSMF